MVGLGSLALVLTGAGPSAAGEVDPRLKAAQERRQEMQRKLDALLQEFNAAQAAADESQHRLDTLTARAEREQGEADGASRIFSAQIRQSYMRATTEPTLAILGSVDADRVVEQAQMLGMLARASRSQFEEASAARSRTRATAAQVTLATEELREEEAELEAKQEEAAALVAETEEQEQEVREILAAEEAARRAEEERRRREAAAREAAEREAAERAARERAEEEPSAASQGSEAPASAAAPAPEVSGGVACPVGQPRNYSDTWGAPRSGGRTHKGVDILAPHGTPIYAYENGTVTRMNSSSLGGISLYLQGDSGDQYYYTHLSGYVGGVSAGSRVSAGQHIAHNGDTGNAAGIPHLHFEVRPGGGSNVNPHPYAQRACG